MEWSPEQRAALKVARAAYYKANPSFTQPPQGFTVPPDIFDLVVEAFGHDPAEPREHLQFKGVSMFRGEAHAENLGPQPMFFAQKPQGVQ